MTTTTTHTTTTCPTWCVHHNRNDSQHPEDRYTDHDAVPVVVTMSRSGFVGGPRDELTMTLHDAVFDVPCDDAWGPVVYFGGSDGSGRVQLSLTVADMEKVAAELLKLVEVARS